MVKKAVAPDNVLGMARLQEEHGLLPVMWMEVEERYSLFTIEIEGKLTTQDQFPTTARYSSHLWPHFKVTAQGPLSDERDTFKLREWDYYFQGGERLRIKSARYVAMVLEALDHRTQRVRPGKLFAEYALEILDVLAVPLIWQPATLDPNPPPDPVVFMERAEQWRHLIDIEVTYMARSSKLSAHEKAEMCDLTRYELPKR